MVVSPQELTDEELRLIDEALTFEEERFVMFCVKDIDYLVTDSNLFYLFKNELKDETIKFLRENL